MSFVPRKKVPSLLSKLTVEQIDKVRLLFDKVPTMKEDMLLQCINKVVPPKDRISAKQFKEIFKEIDIDEDGDVTDIDFLDFMLHECTLKSGSINKALTCITPNASEYFPTHQVLLDVDSMKISAVTMQGLDTICKIYHIETPGLLHSHIKHGKFGLYVTPIGKNNVSFWRLDVTMIVKDIAYNSKELLNLTPTLKAFAQDEKDDVKRLRLQYHKFGPDFDIVCMADIDIMIVYHVFHTYFWVYGMKHMNLRCKIVDLPLEISCADYVSNKGGVCRLLLGGARGGFIILELLSSENILTSHFEDIEQDVAPTHKFKDVVNDSKLRMRHLPCHERGFLTKIQYYNLLLKNYIITSATFDETHPKSCSTLAITEFIPKQEHPQFIDKLLPTVYFKVDDSINTFVAEEAGTLFSGGWDKIIRVWHVADIMEKEQRCHSQFIGHRHPIIGLHYHAKYLQIISMATDAFINVWSFRTRNITFSYSAAHLMPRIYKQNQKYKPEEPDVYPAFYFCPITECLLLGGENLIAIPFGEVKKEEMFTPMAL